MAHLSLNVLLVYESLTWSQETSWMMPPSGDSRFPFQLVNLFGSHSWASRAEGKPGAKKLPRVSERFAQRMICEGRAEGSRARVSRGCWRTLTSAIFHSSETDLLQIGPCRLFSAALGSVAAGVSSQRPLRETRTHVNCLS